MELFLASSTYYRRPVCANGSFTLGTWRAISLFVGWAFVGRRFGTVNLALPIWSPVPADVAALGLFVAPSFAAFVRAAKGHSQLDAVKRVVTVIAQHNLAR